MDSNKTDCFTFFIERPHIREGTQVGTTVKLWIPKVNTDKVYIYHRDGPDGCLGIVPLNYSDIVVSHLVDGLDYDARIVELTDNTCKIKCRLSSREETEHRKKEYKASIRKELTKTYNPQKPITLMIATKNKSTVKKGDKLVIEFNELDSYVQNVHVQSCQWHIKFLNQTGKTVGIFENDKSTIQRVLKAHFNSYLFNVEVLDVAKERSTAWKGYLVELVIKPYKNNNMMST